MNGMKKMSDWVSVSLEVVKEFCERVLDGIHKYNQIIFNTIYFIMSIIAIVLYNTAEPKEWIIGLSLLYIAITIFSAFFKKFDETKNKKKKDFPIYKKRFTKKSELDENMIYIRKEDWSEATLYLSEVEDYLENAGFKKN